MQCRISWLKMLLAVWVVMATVAAGGCGDDEGEGAPDGAAAAGEVEKSAPAPSKGEEPDKKEAESPGEPAPAASAGVAGSGRCAVECARHCASDREARKRYYDGRRKEVERAPISLTLERAYLTGACHKGGDPARRADAAGISAVVEATAVYRGDDILYGAELDGAVLAAFDDGVAEASVPTSYRRGSRDGARFERRVRGSDPWFKGESRRFRWVAGPLNPVFCEVAPDKVEGYLELRTTSVRGGEQRIPVAFVELMWDDVLGRAISQQVKVAVGGAGDEREPAQAQYVKLDRVLVTRLTGKTEWLKRGGLILTDELQKGEGASFPVAETSGGWKIEVKGVSQAAEFGGYAPSDEDQFLVVVNLSISFNPDDPEAVGKLKDLRVALETSPGKWIKPTSKALGQLDTDVELNAGERVSGSMAFMRQRFERPFRLKVTTPSKDTVYLDVFSYDLGPERGGRQGG